MDFQSRTDEHKQRKTESEKKESSQWEIEMEMISNAK